MNIGMLLNAPYPSDIRVFKESNALLKAGFNVFLLCLRKDGEPDTSSYNGLHVTRIDAGKGDLSMAFWDVVLSMTFVHPVFKRKASAWIENHKIDILHVHDLPLVGTALQLKKQHNIPVIADFHENYPEALGTWFEWKKNPIARFKNKLFMNTKRWKRHEHKAVMESDFVITVVEEMRNRLLGEYPVDGKKLVIVSNVEEQSFLNQENDPSVYEAYKPNFILTYTGNIGPHRGVDTVIEAMQYLKEKKINFIIIGSGSSAVMNHLKKLIGELNLGDKVKMLGRQPFEKFFSFMKYSDANVIPHKSNPHTDNTIPHKLFQAMMVGKPVIVSSSDPLKRVINETNAGIIFEAGNARDLANKIVELVESKETQALLGRKGEESTLKGKWNWEHESQGLVKLYASFNLKAN